MNQKKQQINPKTLGRNNHKKRKGEEEALKYLPS